MKALKIVWGSEKTAVIPAEIAGKNYSALSKERPFSMLGDQLEINDLLLLKQVHGVNGLVITQKNKSLPFWVHEGDYLITQQSKIGLAIATADCLPVIVYDSIQGSIAIAHAGWKGLFGGILEKVIDQLTSDYQACIEDLHLYIGPAARGCCYEITEEFLGHIPKILTTTAIQKKENKLNFDLVTYAKEIAFSKGILLEKTDISNAFCTICSENFCSSRRQNRGPLRQLSVVSLK